MDEIKYKCLNFNSDILTIIKGKTKVQKAS